MTSILIGQMFVDLDKRMEGRCLIVYQIGEKYALLHDSLRPAIRTKIRIDRLLNPRLFSVRSSQ